MFIQIQETPNFNTLKFLPGVEILHCGNNATNSAYNSIDNSVDNNTIQQKIGITLTKNTPNLRKTSSFASIILEINGINSIYFGHDSTINEDFISITKDNSVNWDDIKTLILSEMMDAITTDRIKITTNIIKNENNNVSNIRINGRNETNDKSELCKESNTDKSYDETKLEELTDLNIAIVNQIKELIETMVKPAVAQDGGNIEFYDFDFENGIVYLQLYGACSGCPSALITLKDGVENMLMHYVPEVKEVRAID